jgi:hypothetical protein
LGGAVYLSSKPQEEEELGRRVHGGSTQHLDLVKFRDAAAETWIISPPGGRIR